MTMRGTCRIAVTFAALAVIASACSSSGTGHPSSGIKGSASPTADEVGGDPLTIRTADGPVHGQDVGKVRDFLGIPYAAPPVGNLRWEPPQPPATWSAVRSATSPGSECTQIVPVINAAVGNEDCLYANVFSPTSPTVHPRPVMVWIYGGGFTVGSGMDDNPSRLVADSGVVAVTFNYRLGPFGFLGSSALAASDTSHSTGNFGLQDQQAALKWVQSNAAAFGGDAQNVTIFGESAGGMSVCDQLLMPGAAGLFSKGITESGPCTLPSISLAAADSQSQKFAGKLGCPGAQGVVACLRTKSANQVVEALPPDPTFVFGAGGNWGPVADGVVLPTDPVAAIEAGKFDHVPLIVGANRDEGRLFVALAYNVAGSNLTASSWASTVDGYFGPVVGAAVQREYPLADYPDAGAAFGQAIGDALLACPSVQSASVLSRYVPVYEYEYDQTQNVFVLPSPGITLGAFHSSELPYVFDGPVESSGLLTFTAAQQHLATTMSSAWTRFAATGDPAGSGLNWPRLGQSGSYLSFNIPVAVDSGMKSGVCAFWSSSGWSVNDAP